MANPREILSRAGARSNGMGEKQPSQSLPTPPGFISVEKVEKATPTPMESEPVRVTVPQPIRENSLYHQLMRSHDRMGTMHLRKS